MNTGSDSLDRSSLLHQSIVAFTILALLGGALQSDREQEGNALRTTASGQYEAKVFVDCNMAALANSANRTELMSLCWRKLIQAAVLRVSACIALFDAFRLADWRAARLLFNCMFGPQDPTPALHGPGLAFKIKNSAPT
jgi:hypothetical protein